MKSYVISIVSSAILCGIIKNFIEEKTTIGKILRILSAVLMVITIFNPLKHYTFFDINGYIGDFKDDGQKYMKAGEEFSKQSIQEIIKSETEAYILDKAQKIDTDISVEVEFNSEDLVPCGIMINGDISPYAKEVLKSFVEDNLGITEENQIWN